MRNLAEEAGISTDTIAALEKGRRNAWPRNVRKLAVALGVEPRELIKGSLTVPDTNRHGSKRAILYARVSPMSKQQAAIRLPSKSKR